MLHYFQILYFEITFIFIYNIDSYIITQNIILVIVDCVWGAFDEWTDCSADCGTGTQTRTRREEKSEENGGAACIGEKTETRDCNTHDCPGT